MKSDSPADYSDWQKDRKESTNEKGARSPGLIAIRFSHGDLAVFCLLFSFRLHQKAVDLIGIHSMQFIFKIFFPAVVLLFSGCFSSKQAAPLPKILVFSATRSFRHKSIDTGKMALLKLGKDNRWLVDTTENVAIFTKGRLKSYSAIVFLNTSGDILNNEEQLAFQRYIQSGGGFVGIHAAADTESDWPWYNNLVGAYFQSHPEPQVALYNVINKNHPAVRFMPDTLRRLEEIYNFKSLRIDSANILITVDENSYTGGSMQQEHPVAWYHNCDGGRAFYTAWGHRPEAFSEPLFLRHLEGAIRWAMGDKNSKATKD